MLESVHSRLTAPQQRQPPASSQYRRVPGLQSPGAIIVGAMSAGRIWDLGISTAFAFSPHASQLMYADAVSRSFKLKID